MGTQINGIIEFTWAIIRQRYFKTLSNKVWIPESKKKPDRNTPSWKKIWKKWRQCFEITTSAVFLQMCASKRLHPLCVFQYAGLKGCVILVRHPGRWRDRWSSTRGLIIAKGFQVVERVGFLWFSLSVCKINLKSHLKEKPQSVSMTMGCASPPSSKAPAVLPVSSFSGACNLQSFLFMQRY